MKRIISVLCVLMLIVLCFAGCSDKTPAEVNAPVEGNTLKFTNLVTDMKALDGQTVTLTGYMSKALSAKEGIIYVMNAPCRETPFAEDNSAQLADTLAVHLGRNVSAEFTEKLITVEGTLTFEEYTDVKGYTYGYYLKNSTFAVSEGEGLEGKAADWHKLTCSGVIEKVNGMYGYVSFLCNWTATVNGDGEYSTPTFALYNIENEGAIYYYGYEEGYFDGLIEEIKALDGDFSSLVSSVEKAKALSEKALLALQNGEYSLSGDGSGMYVHKNGDEIKNEYTALYSEYSEWLKGWTL